MCKYCDFKQGDPAIMIDSRWILKRKFVISEGMTKSRALGDQRIDIYKEKKEIQDTRLILNEQILDDNLLCLYLGIDSAEAIDEIFDPEIECEANVRINYCPMCGRKLKEAADETISQSDQG